MPWFRIDDGVHSHPKMRRAGPAAVGVWALGGSYASAYGTDGHLDAHWVKAAATAPQLRKLLDSGLWHAAGHDCPRCPNVAEGDYYMHDYLRSNPSAAEIAADRERARVKKEKQRAAAVAAVSDAESAPDGRGSGGESAPNPPRFADDSAPNRRRIADVDAGGGDVSPGDGPGTRARAAQPSPAQPASPTGMAAQQAPRVPLAEVTAAVHEVIAAVSAAGGSVDWTTSPLTPAEKRAVHGLVARHGAEDLAAVVLGRPAAAGKPCRYWLGPWADLDRPATVVRLSDRRPALPAGGAAGGHSDNLAAALAQLRATHDEGTTA